jgi:hypothetical protein
MFAESFIAEFDCFFVQIKPIAFVSGFEHTVEESASTASWFEQTSAFAFDMFIECCGEKFVFSYPVA